jgi:hypothetical protein
MQQQHGQQQTGTRNETYDVIAVLYHALQGAENCQTYMNDAQDGQLRDYFQKALQMQRQIADEGKQVLQQCLQKEGGSGRSAFGWGNDQSSGEGSSSMQGNAEMGDAANQTQRSFADQESTSGGR